MPAITHTNKKKKKLYYEVKIIIKNTTLKETMGGETNSTPSFIESDGLFITKPFEVTNYFNDCFIGKVANLGRECQQRTVHHACIQNYDERKAL